MCVSSAASSDGLAQEYKTTLQECQGTLQQQSSHIKKLSSENESLRDTLENIQDDLVELSALKFKVQRLTEVKTSLSARVDELSEEVDRSRRQLKQRETELVDSHDTAREALENQLADLKKRCAMLELSLKQTQEKLSEKVSKKNIGCTYFL